MSEYISAFKQLDSSTILLFGVMLFALIIIILVSVLFIKKDGERGKEIRRETMLAYYNDLASLSSNSDKYVPSGNVYLRDGELIYERGSDRITIDTYIDRNEVVLYPSLISDWFKNRNYTLRQQELIFADIAKFLIDNKLTKKVTVLTDEEAEKYFGEI